MPSSGSKMSSAPSLAASSTFNQSSFLRNSRNNLKDQNYSPLLSEPQGCWRSPWMKETKHIYDKKNTQTTSLAGETLRPVSPPPWCKSSMCSLPTPASPTSALIFFLHKKTFATLRVHAVCSLSIFLRPGARTLPRASDQLLEKLEFGFLDFCSLLWPWP